MPLGSRSSMAAAILVGPFLASGYVVPCAHQLVPLRASAAATRAVTFACDYEDDGTADEYEEALKRYTAWGLIPGDSAAVEEDDDDDITTEQMQEWSKARMDAAVSSTNVDRSTPNNLSMMAAASETAEFTVETVDKVLDEVRPYLIADGGNVAVVSVDESTMGVTLALQGACGSCPSSTVTMKMGIERVLRENWPNLGAVMQTASEELEEAAATLTTDVVEEALEPIMPAIAGLGGKLAVLSAEAGVVRLEYSGPEKTKMGIQLSLRDHPLINQVVFV